MVLFKEAYETGNRSRAFEIWRSLQRTLLMAVVAPHLSSVALELFEFFINCRVLLAQARWLERVTL